MPYFGTADDGSQQGFDADFLNQFAADSCLTVDWQVLPAASVIEAVQSGRADVAAGGWYATPERGEVVNLSDPTYVELPMIFSTDGTTDIQALAGKTVGTVTGYTWIDELKAIADVKEYQSSDATLADIAAGRLDYALLGSIDAPYIVTQNPAYSGIQGNLMLPDAAISSSVTPSLPNYPSTKGNDELTAAINEAIAAAKADGSFATILGTYGLSADLLNTDNFQ
jgi:polar amino acid transport system substrate-binding protein